MDRPPDWKDYDDFSAGIDTNRLPSTAALGGREWVLVFADGSTRLAFASATQVDWSDAGAHGRDAYDAVEVAPDTYFVDIAPAARPREALTLIVSERTGRVLRVRQAVDPERHDGQPQLRQSFAAGRLPAAAAPLAGPPPGPTRDLIGLRAFYRYSPRHLYEHIYLSSERYCWQCLAGEQRGHGDVDLATTWRFDQDQYVFAFREFLIPVASVFFYDMVGLRSTGKFLGLTADGRIENRKAGAWIRKASMTYYDPEWAPV